MAAPVIVNVSPSVSVEDEIFDVLVSTSYTFRVNSFSAVFPFVSFTTTLILYDTAAPGLNVTDADVVLAVFVVHEVADDVL